MNPAPNPQAEIAIVTDSTADVPAVLVEKHAITVIPNLIMVDGQSLVDGRDITREEFYERLPDMKSVSTGTASSGKYIEIYHTLFRRGFRHVLSIHASSMLSGIYNAASVAAQSFSGRVTVFDSQQISMGVGFQVLAAAEAIASGLPLQKILPYLEDINRRIRLVAMLDTLEYVRRSGRISWAKARMGELLRIKPFIAVKDGTLISLGEARTTSKGLARLREMLLNLGPIDKLAILHTNAEELARRFLDSLPAPLPENPLLVNVTTVIGTHAGPNGIGFSVVLH